MALRRREGANLGLWAGRLYIWPGRALYVGEAADTAVHAHHAVQVSIALESEFALRGEAAERWHTYEIALVEPDRRHEIDGRGKSLALLYLDPESVEVGQILGGNRKRGDSHRGDGWWRELRPQLGECVGKDCSLKQARGVVDALLRSLAPSIRSEETRLDPRVVSVIESLRSAPERRILAGEAAAAVGLSSHRFQHLFRDSTGIPFRRYQLWLKLIGAVEAVAGGASLTEAAHTAGFSDSSHLSRTFRQNFGLSPSSISRSSEFIRA